MRRNSGFGAELKLFLRSNPTLPRTIGELAARYGTVAMVADGGERRAGAGPGRSQQGAIASVAAIETADIACMTHDVSKLSWLLRHAKRTLAPEHHILARRKSRPRRSDLRRPGKPMGPNGCIHGSLPSGRGQRTLPAACRSGHGRAAGESPSSAAKYRSIIPLKEPLHAAPEAFLHLSLWLSGKTLTAPRSVRKGQ